MTRSAFSLALAAVLLQAPASQAAQLDKESCTKLKSEQVELEKEGARNNLGKGPDWAKANLAPEKIEHVRRLIEVDEELLFRCGGRPLVVLPSDPDAAPGEGVVERPEKAPVDNKAKSPPDAGKKATAPLPKAIAPAPKTSPPAPKATEPSTAPKATATPLKETAKEVRPLAPLPRGNAPAGAANTLAKETAPAGSEPPTQAAPPAPPAKEDPSQATPLATPAATPAATMAAPTAAAADEKKAAALKAAKAKAKKKAEDAYRPPAPEWYSNPFADQTAPAAKK
jgi:hypothetical protein